MATNRNSNRSSRRYRVGTVAAAIAVAFVGATANPASAENSPSRPTGLLGIDLGIDLSGQGPLIGIDLGLGGGSGTSGNSGAGTGVNVGVGVGAGTGGGLGVGATVDANVVGLPVNADVGATVGQGSVASVQADATVGAIDATATVGVLSGNGSLANVCADVRLGVAECSPRGSLGVAGLTSGLGLNGIAVLDVLDTSVLAACLDLSLGASTACDAAAAPITTDPTSNTTDPTDVPISRTLSGVQAFVAPESAAASSGRGSVAALAFTGAGVVGLLALGLSAIGSGSLLRWKARASAR